MKPVYVLADKKQRLVQSVYNGIFSPDGHTAVITSDKYKDAKKFRSLFWAIHRAKFLSSHSNTYYYVYQAAPNGNQYLLSLVDGSINDKLIQQDEKAQKEIDDIIADWRYRKGLSK